MSILIKILSLSFFQLLIVTFSYTQAAASVDPNTFVGQYRVGDCSSKNIISVLVSSVIQWKTAGLKVTFMDRSNSVYKENFVGLSSFESVLDANGVKHSLFSQVHLDNFSISNSVFENTYGTKALVKTLILARSASGGRARLMEFNAHSQKIFECVFYSSL